MTGYELCGGYWWIFLLVMIFFCFYFMRGCSGRRMCGWGAGNGPEETAIDLLKKRYAKGEIDQKEYEEKRKNLEEGQK